jgi:hypothetical protein
MLRTRFLYVLIYWRAFRLFLCLGLRSWFHVFEYVPRSGVAELMIILFLIILRQLFTVFSSVSIPFDISINRAQVSIDLHPYQHLFSFVFWWWTIGIWKVLSITNYQGNANQSHKETSLVYPDITCVFCLPGFELSVTGIVAFIFIPRI